jgi:hypothetical protein
MKLCEDYIKVIETMEVTDEVEVEGVGSAVSYGELDLEGLIRTLLKYKAITGKDDGIGC